MDDVTAEHPGSWHLWVGTTTTGQDGADGKKQVHGAATLFATSVQGATRGIRAFSQLVRMRYLDKEHKLFSFSKNGFLVVQGAPFAITSMPSFSQRDQADTDKADTALAHLFDVETDAVSGYRKGEIESLIKEEMRLRDKHRRDELFHSVHNIRDDLARPGDRSLWLQATSMPELLERTEAALNLGQGNLKRTKVSKNDEFGI